MAVFDHGASWNCSSNGLSVKIECEEKLGLWCTTSYVDGGGEGTGFGSGVARGGFGGFKPPHCEKMCIFYCLVFEQKRWLSLHFFNSVRYSLSDDVNSPSAHRK